MAKPASLHVPSTTKTATAGLVAMVAKLATERKGVANRSSHDDEKQKASTRSDTRIYILCHIVLDVVPKIAQA